MGIKSTFCVLALAAATVIGLSLTTQKAQAFPIEHLTSTVQAGMLAKPPSGGNKGSVSNKTSVSNKNFVSNKNSVNTNKSFYSSSSKQNSHCWYSCYPWFNGYCYNCFGCYNCYSPYSCYGWYNCCPDPTLVEVPSVTPVDIEVSYNKTVK
jgi:hypothetical protein